MRWGLGASVLIITSSMLLCQSIILNRSHLNAVATVSGEWRAIDDEVRWYTCADSPFIYSLCKVKEGEVPREDLKFTRGEALFIANQTLSLQYEDKPKPSPLPSVSM